MSKLSLTLCTFSITGSVAGLFLTDDIIINILIRYGIQGRSFSCGILLPHLVLLISCLTNLIFFPPIIVIRQLGTINRFPELIGEIIEVFYFFMVQFRQNA